MISFSPIDAIGRAERLLESTIHRNSQGAPSPEDIARLLAAKEQVSAGVRVAQTQDELDKKILDVLA